MKILLYPAIAALVSVFSVSALPAAFIADYEIGAPGTYALENNSTTAFGNWSASVTGMGGGGSATLDTTDVPDTITLSVTGDGGFGPMTGALWSLNLSFAEIANDGTVSFTTSSTTGLQVLLDGTPQTPAGLDYSFDVLLGQSLSFRLTAMGSSGSTTFDPIMGMPIWESGDPVTHEATISNFSGPLSAVPEPSTYALLAGLGVLGFMVVRRRRSKGEPACPHVAG